MKVEKIFSRFSVFIIISFFISITVIASNENNYKKAQTMNAIVNINSFMDFELGTLGSEVETQKSNSNIIFEFNSENNSVITCWYALVLDDYGNCSDFDIELTMDYNYTGSDMFGRFTIMLGCYYNSKNEFITKELIPEPNNERTLISLYIEDLMVTGAYEGHYFTSNDLANFGYGYFDDTDKARALKYNFSRTTDVLTWRVAEEDEILFGGPSYGGLGKYLNYIMLIVEIHGDKTDYVTCKFRNLVANLNCTYGPPTSPVTPPTLNTALQFSYFGFLFMIFILKKYKRKTQQ